MPIDVPAEGDFGAALRRGAARPDRRRGRRPARGLRAAGRSARRSSPTRGRVDAYAAAYARYRALYPAIKEALRHEHRLLRRPAADPLRGAGEPQPASPSAATTRTGWCSASAWRIISASPSATGTPSPGRAATRSAARPSSGPGSATAWRRRRLKADVAFEMFELLGVPFFTFHDRDIAPEGATLAEIEPQRPRRSPTSSRSKMEKREGRGCSGAPRTSSPTAATWPAPPPTPIPTSSPTPPRR